MLKNVVLLIAALVGCGLHGVFPSRVDAAPAAAGVSAGKLLAGTWISPEEGYPMKIRFTVEGRQEFFLGILDPRPVYWVECGLDGEVAGPDGTRWLQLSLFCAEPFCSDNGLEGFGLASVSSGGDRLTLFLGDRKVSPAEAAGGSKVYLRDGSPSAAAVKDLPSASRWVAIVRSEPACMVFFGLADEEEAARARSSLGPQAEVLPWEEFVPRSGDIIEGFPIHDDYGCVQLVAGIIAILRDSDTRVGVTWNSGVAFTNLDFDLAEEYLSNFRTDRAGYEEEKFLFPHDPMEHFSGLLGW